MSKVRGFFERLGGAARLSRESPGHRAGVFRCLLPVALLLKHFRVTSMILKALYHKEFSALRQFDTMSKSSGVGVRKSLTNRLEPWHDASHAASLTSGASIS